MNFTPAVFLKFKDLEPMLDLFYLDTLNEQHILELSKFNKYNTMYVCMQKKANTVL